MTPPFKDYMNNLQTYQYLQQLENPELMQARHTQITQQYSSSTDEGCDTDHGGKRVKTFHPFTQIQNLYLTVTEMDETPPTSTTIASTIQRLNSYASSSSSSGVVTNFASKSLSQNLSCESSRSNFSTFESLDLNLSDCSDLASSLPSCASTTVANEEDNREDGNKIKMRLCCVKFKQNVIPASYRPVTSNSTIHPCVYVSMSIGKSPCSFLRSNPMAHPTCRAVTRSPVDFRLGRRASDGLVAQGILSQVDNSMNSVAFNSQRLHEACKAKGVLELHLLQQEAASLSSQYQSCVPQEEISSRQREHNQFHITPFKTSNDQNGVFFHCGYKNDDLNYFNKSISGVTSDISNYVGMMKNDELNGMKQMTMNIKNEPHGVQSSQQPSPLQKPPLQQQLMQHRLLQQKRQILQKQGAMETCLSRRQMLRQQSYKMAQNQQILPPLPLPLSEKESEELLAFQQKIENASSPTSIGPTGLMKTTHLHSNQVSPSISPHPQSAENGVWNNLANNLNSCQISEATDIFHSSLFHQVR